MIITFVGNFSVSYTSETHHANTLNRLGHSVIRLQEGSVKAHDILHYAKQSDLLVWVHTHGWKTIGAADVLKELKKLNIPTLTYHLDLWLGLDRQSDLDKDDFYKHIGYFFTVDKLMADWFNNNTEVKGHYLQAAVYEPEAYMVEAEKTKDVVFVGSKGYHPEWQYRPQLVDWLGENYGRDFHHYGNDGIKVIRGAELNQIYGQSKIVIGDSLCLNFDYPYYWSDRVYETLGRGGFMIHPYITGMESHFEDRKHLIYYEFGNFSDLRTKVDYYLDTPHEREAIRKAGHEHVKANHTYTNRWQTILEIIKKGQ